MTEKHKQEAREIVQSRILRWHTTGDVEPSSLDVHRVINTELLTECIAIALSSHDKEIREVLEGLVIRRYDNVPCWCDKGRAIPMGLNHEPACLAARGLWERVRT